MSDQTQDRARSEPSSISGKDYNLLTALVLLRMLPVTKAFIGTRSSPMQFEDVQMYRVAKEIAGLPGRRTKRERELARSFVRQIALQYGRKELIDFKDSQLAAEVNQKIIQIIRPKIIRQPTAKYLQALDLIERCIKLADKPEHVTEKSSHPFSSMVAMECKHQGLSIYVRGQMSGYSNGSLIVQVRQNKQMVFSTRGPYMGGETEVIRFIRGPWEYLLK